MTLDCKILKTNCSIASHFFVHSCKFLNVHSCVNRLVKIQVLLSFKINTYIIGVE